MFNSIIIVASGSSRRAGFDKLMAPLGGKPVLAHSLEAFAQCEGVGEIILATTEERFIALRDAIAGVKVPVKRVDGGSERHFSVAAGLAALDAESEYVAIHDGARPLIRPEEIRACFEKVQEHKAVALAHPLVETVKRADESGFSDGAVDRTNLWIMETPQVFSVSLIKDAYQRVLEEGILVTDEVSALESMGHRTFFLHNPAPNIKITHAGDLPLAEQLKGLV